MKPPTTVKETRRFLGMVGFYKKQIEGFAKIATPITNLVRKDTSFIWTEWCNQAFETPKQGLTTAPVLVKADINQPFYFRDRC